MHGISISIVYDTEFFEMFWRSIVQFVSDETALILLSAVILKIEYQIDYHKLLSYLPASTHLLEYKYVYFSR